MNHGYTEISRNERRSMSHMSTAVIHSHSVGLLAAYLHHLAPIGYIWRLPHRHMSGLRTED